MPAQTRGIHRTEKGWVASVSRNRVRKTRLCRTKDDALVARKEMLEDLILKEAKGSFGRSYTVQDAVNASLRDRWITAPSVRSIQSNTDQMIELLGATTPLHLVDYDMALRYRSTLMELGDSPATVNKKVGQLRSLLIDAVQSQRLERLPAAWPKRLRIVDKKTRVISDEERQGITYYFEQNDLPECAALFNFLLDTCARWSEARNLKVENVDLTLGSVNFIARKPNNSLTVRLTKRAHAICAARVHREEFVFSPDLTYKVMNSRLKDAKEALGIKDRTLTIHTTRHTAATKMAVAGCSVAEIMAFGGWEDPNSVKRYIHLAAQHQSRCVEALEG